VANEDAAKARACEEPWAWSRSCARHQRAVRILRRQRKLAGAGEQRRTTWIGQLRAARPGLAAASREQAHPERATNLRSSCVEDRSSAYTRAGIHWKGNPWIMRMLDVRCYHSRATGV